MEEEHTLEFELPAPVANPFSAHTELAHTLGLDQGDALLWRTFAILAGLCDPVTQPEDNETVPLSVHTLSSVAITLSYHTLVELRGKREEEREEPWMTYASPDVASLRFTLSTKLFAILLAIHKVLHADDELRVLYLHNNVKHWEETAVFWLPNLGGGYDDDDDDDDAWQELKLLYYICCVVVMALHRLFAPVEGPYNAALNPYLDHFLRLWKTHTSIIALALEMDRELEELAWANEAEYMGMPGLVKRALLGSSAVRCVLAYTLEPTEGKPPASGDAAGRPALENDLWNDSLINFYDPLGRSKNCGALSADKRIFTCLASVRRQGLDVPPIETDYRFVHEVPFPHFDQNELDRRILYRQDPVLREHDLCVDIYYQDQFDDDVKYVFGYFDSEDEGSEKSDLSGMAERQKEDEIEFDEHGRDWRDCARGKNNLFTPEFLHLEAESKKLGDERLSDHFFYTWFELQQALEFLAIAKIENVDTFIDRVGQVTVDTVAKSIRDEVPGRANKISPDKVYSHLVQKRADLYQKSAPEFPLLSFLPATKFELILRQNPHCAMALLDELFMCKGLRRSLIWFLTHNVNPLMTLINYMFELVSGLRGNSEIKNKYNFSRQGFLEITPVEQLMILHELFTYAAAVTSAGDTKMSRLAASRIILCLCVMIQNLVRSNIIKKNSDDQFENYSHDIQVLLVPWIGKMPEARELFFLFKLDEYRPLLEPKEDVLVAEKDPSAVDDDILAAIESLRGLSVADYAEKLLEQRIQDTFERFAHRVFVHLQKDCPKVHQPSLSLPETYLASQDYGIFLTHFDEISRNSTFAKTLADLYYDHDMVYEQEQGKEEEAPEFSEAFLNGEGDFQEKKKKKKGKKRGKKKK